MKSFKDRNGRDWVLDITYSTIRRVRELGKVDLLSVFDEKQMEKLSSDPIALIDTIYLLVKPEADKAGITSEQFGESMAGDSIADATNAMMEALADFFPSRKRGLIQALLKKTDQIQDQATTATMQKIESLTLEQLTGSSGDAPASPALIPDPSASAT